GFRDELLKQGAQVQFRSHLPVRQNGKGAIGFALKMPANNFWRVTFCALLALRAAARPISRHWHRVCRNSAGPWVATCGLTIAGAQTISIVFAHTRWN